MDAYGKLRSIQKNIESCILGKRDEIQLVITALLANGHVLLEDVPGTGKTVLIKALAKSIQGQFRRIQCNPDLLPTDITGVSIYHPKSEDFLFRAGPIMTNILLIDEINRATTKTQAALLEAMEERHVTVDGVCHQLPSPFFLLATQNPLEFAGTFGLPEAQLDRFLLKLQLGYPDFAAEKQMVYAQSKAHPVDSLPPVVTVEELLQLQEMVKDIFVDEALVEYVITVTRKTREHPDLLLGASPRATLALLQAAKAYALLQERMYVLPDDIKHLAPFVLAHRMMLSAEARMRGVTADDVLQSIFQQLKVPV